MPRKKKLLYVVEAMGGGIFTYIVDMANILVNAYDLYIAYAVRSQTPKDFQNYFNSRIHLIQVQHFTRSIAPQKDIPALIELIKIRKTIKPDIVHLHSAKAGVVGWFAFAFCRAPLFYTPHGYSFLMEDISKVKRSLYYFIEKICCLGRRVTISCSLGEHQETLKLTRNAEYVNNGIDICDVDKYLDRIRDTKREKRISRDQTLKVFTLGRVCYQKNPHLFAEIAKRMPEVHFTWIGSGEDCSCLNVPNIEVTGWLERAEALQKASEADVFLLTSRWEGLPISLLEAMYMKKLCIVSDVVGNHDVIKNGRNGFVCSSLEAFCTAIAQAHDDEVRNKLCKAAQKEIMSEYNTSVMAEKYMGIYQNALEGRKIKQ